MVSVNSTPALFLLESGRFGSTLPLTGPDWTELRLKLFNDGNLGTEQSAHARPLSETAEMLRITDT